MEVRTQNGTVYKINGNHYVRIRPGSIKEYTCVAWGGVTLAQPGDLADQGLVLGALMPTPAGIQVVPVTVRVGEVEPGMPLCFVIVREGRLTLHLSTPVVEVDGKTVTPEGAATELPPELKKLLGIDE